MTAPLTAETDPLDTPFEVIEFTGQETLREFVRRHLNDPDLWPTVLRINQLASPADLTPGAMLFMPVTQVALADGALLSSLQAIQSATAQGARLFAPIEIGEAIDSRDIAVQRREVGEWRDVIDYTELATARAQEAYDISIKQRDRAAEALITDIHGNVEGRDPAEPAWSDRSLNDVLVEFERLRTLSNSTTQVTFRDLSRLRLNPNSNATIQAMRTDPLTGKEVTKVSLSNGDFYALLNQLSTRDEFEIEVPGIETRTESGDFWVKNDATGARFVNYDKASVDITAGTQTVKLGQNEGVVISGGSAKARTAVLDSARALAPVGGETVYGGSAPLRWDVFEGAAGYWIELASDPDFNQMVASEWGIPETGFDVNGLDIGDYHWRVAALDALGLPGQWSKTETFKVRYDTTPPFLTILAPGRSSNSETDRIEVFGATEQYAVLTLNGKVTEIAADGSFFADVALRPGLNRIAITATDPAGNISEKVAEVSYRPPVSVEIVLADTLPRDGAVLLSATGEMTILATSTAAPGVAVRVIDADGALAAQGRVQGDGGVTLTVPATDEGRDFVIEVLAPSGAVEGRLPITVRRDTTPPALALDMPPPLATQGLALTLTGTVEPGAVVTLDDRSVPVTDGRFVVAVELAAGRNAFELRARDAAGNTALVTATTLQDSDPPEIVRAEATRPDGDDGPIEILVEANDISGLRQAAEFLVEIGNSEYEGLMRCDAALNICRATLPPEPGALNLVEVIVQDYAGNEAIR
ncbi:FecR domain-containing protein [Shimia biformata]|uniref:FecR domain-containing protein n=1 Tax=Shimia biformata TaxID=1294299 RepID=UPI001952881E|nr:FecR domain-containing protein [Shimia biformata]